MKNPVRYSGPCLYRSGRCKGRKYMMVWYDDGSKGTTLYSRYLMRNRLGEIPLGQTVDHVNEDKADDREDNLQLLSRSDNAAKSARLNKRITWIEFDCPQCHSPARRDARQVRHSAKQGKKGPYCSRKCARQAQLERDGSKPVSCGTNAMYARGCRCGRCKIAHNATTNEWKRRQKRGSDGGLVQPAALRAAECNVH